MREFIVNVREVHIQMVRIGAKDKEEAKEKVVAGEGDYLDDTLEYSHTLDSDYWTVEEVKDEES